VLLLYSDGLIERPGQTTNDGLDALAHTASSATTTQGRTVAPNPADRITSLVVERLARTGYIDDVTVLAAHRLPAPTPLFEARLESGLHELPEMRAALLGWLDQLGARRDDQLAVTLATWEAAANALEHAHHRREPQPGRVLARLDGDGAVTITIEDSGRWREPQSHRGGGRGLNLIRSLSDEVQIERGAGGTTLTLRRRLLHPTVIGLSEHLAPTAMAMPRFQAAITRVDPTVLEITGPLDATTTDQLRAAVMHHANAADQPLVVDLTPVSFLASSGVQLLHDLSADLGDGLRLHATPGCPAAYVLKLTGLDRLLAQTEAGCHR
jgi:anti-anti-sigma factor